MLVQPANSHHWSSRICFFIYLLAYYSSSLVYCSQELPSSVGFIDAESAWHDLADLIAERPYIQNVSVTTLTLDTDLYAISFNNKSNRIYIGSNIIYTLNLNLDKNAEPTRFSSIGNSTADQKRTDECPYKINTTDNHLKTIIPYIDGLIVCGTGNCGQCVKHSYENLEESSSFHFLRLVLNDILQASVFDGDSSKSLCVDEVRETNLLSI